jgi:hypothetical protein
MGTEYVRKGPWPDLEATSAPYEGTTHSVSGRCENLRMPEPWDDVEWSHLIHASGSAADVPERFDHWVGSDARKKLDAETYLRNVAFGYGVWPASAPIVAAFVGLLGDPRLEDFDVHSQLLFVDRIAQSCDMTRDTASTQAVLAARTDEIQDWSAAYAAAEYGELAGLRKDGTGIHDLVCAQSELACLALVPRLVETLLSFFDDPRIVWHGWLAATLAMLSRHPLVRDQRPAFATRVEQKTRAATHDVEVATYLIALGDLGGDTRPWLNDPHPGIRASAAMAEDLAGDGTAAMILRALSEEPGAYLASFDKDFASPAQFMTGRDPLAEAIARLDRH